MHCGVTLQLRGSSGRHQLVSMAETSYTERRSVLFQPPVNSWYVEGLTLSTVGLGMLITCQECLLFTLHHASLMVVMNLHSLIPQIIKKKRGKKKKIKKGLLYVAHV